MESNSKTFDGEIRTPVMDDRMKKKSMSVASSVIRSTDLVERQSGFATRDEALNIIGIHEQLTLDHFPKE